MRLITIITNRIIKTIINLIIDNSIDNILYLIEKKYRKISM